MSALSDARAHLRKSAGVPRRCGAQLGLRALQRSDVQRGHQRHQRQGRGLPRADRDHRHAREPHRCSGRAPRCRLGSPTAGADPRTAP